MQKSFKSGFLVAALLAVAIIAGVGWASATLDQYIQRGALASIILVSGSDTYVAEAVPGTAATTAAWRVKKINVTGGATVISWADGNDLWDNIPGAAGAGLAALTYQ